MSPRSRAKIVNEVGSLHEMFESCLPAFGAGYLRRVFGITVGSLAGCPPAEAVTWGKVDKDHFVKTTESTQGDYSMVMPFVVRALLGPFVRRFVVAGNWMRTDAEPTW